MTPTKIAVIGAGWRADFHLRLALMMPERFEIVGWVARNPQKQGKYQVPTYSSIGDLLAHEKPHYVVSAVSSSSNPEILTQLVNAGIPALSETPPADDLLALRNLWEAAGSKDLVQVAEQYMRLPMHAARLAVTKRGEIGEITSVQVSSTHGYHAVSMMRTILGAGFSRAEIRATSFTAPLIDPLARDGWSEDLAPKSAKTVLATIDFQEGKS